MAFEGSLVSVVIPVRNGERFINETLASALAQTYEPLEVVVVDDGSTDRTAVVVEAAALRDNRIRLFRTQRFGVASARNFGISQARGGLIAPLDADDLWHPEKIARQVYVIQTSSPEVGLVYCWSIEIDENDLVIPAIRSLKGGSTARGRVSEELARGCFIETGSSPVIKRSFIDAVGGYDATLQPQGADDWKLYFALSEVCEFAVIPEYLVGYRQTSGSVSRNLTAMGQSMESVASWIFEKRPNLPKMHKRQAMHSIHAFMSRRAFDNYQFGAALRYHAKALKAYPGKLLERDALIFVARCLFRMTGLRRAMFGRPAGTSPPPVRFQDFADELEKAINSVGTSATATRELVPSQATKDDRRRMGQQS
jgi:glycosyltransferase involved in cell wall biosynthesis